MKPHRGEPALDRSAAILLARLRAQGPLSMGELARAFGLDTSTLQRQLAAAMRAGLIERIRDPRGGQARLHRPTPEGLRRLEAEMAARQKAVAELVEDWPEGEQRELARLLERFNREIERVRDQPWPRAATPYAADPDPQSDPGPQAG